MTQPPSVQLDYRGKGDPPQRDPNAAKKFACGLFAGIAVSAILWLPHWQPIVGREGGNGVGGYSGGPWFVAALWGVLALKLGGGVALAFVRVTRGFGVGLITSLMVGAMISVFSMCR